MPNWTSNRIYIEGEPIDIRAFLEAVKWEDRIFDFNRILPMPEALQGTVSGFTRIDGKEVASWKEDIDAEGKVVPRLFTAEEQRELEKMAISIGTTGAAPTGAPNGTPRRPPSSPTSRKRLSRNLRGTAWAPPVPVFLKLREIFPTLPLIAAGATRMPLHPFPHSLDEVG